MIYAPWVGDGNPDYAFLAEKLPENIEEFSGLIRFGSSLKDCFPDDVVFDLSTKKGGIKLADYIPNTRDMLIVSERLKDILAKTGEHFEFYKVSIRNHKKRLVKEPYFLAQLIGSLPCMDMDKSDYDMSAIDKTQARRIRRLVLDESKIPEGKQIFRLGEMEELIIVNRDLAYEIYRVHECRGMIFQVMEEYGAMFRN